MDVQLGEYFEKIIKRKASKVKIESEAVSFMISLKDDSLMFRFLDRKGVFLLNKESENHQIEDLFGIADRGLLLIIASQGYNLEDIITKTFLKVCEKNELSVDETDLIFNLGIT